MSHENLCALKSYLTSGKFSNKLSSLLFNLRSHCVNEFRSNFQSSTQHILCPVCKLSDDTQEHAILCEALEKHMERDHKDILKNVKYVDIFGSQEEQLRITKTYSILISVREKLCEPQQGLPGHNT